MPLPRYLYHQTKGKKVGAACFDSAAAKMDDRNWAMVVSLAGVNPPSAETKKLVIEILHEREDACRCLANLDLYPAAA